MEKQPTALFDGDTIAALDATEKRPRATPSVEISGSRLSDPPLPLSKKAKITDEDKVSRSPLLGIHAALPSNLPTGQTQAQSTEEPHEDRNSPDPAASSGVDFWLLPSPTNTVSAPVAMETSSTGAKAGSGYETILMADTRLWDELVRSIEGLEVDSGVFAPPSLDQVIQKPRGDPYRRHLHMAQRLTNAALCFPSKMLPSLISQACQSRLCRAADWLHAVWNRQDSFSIYSLLTKLEDISDGGLSRSHILSPMVLSCVRSAETPSQRTLARELLLTRLRSLAHDGIGSSETMLSHMLLAHMFAQDEHLALSEKHLKAALKPSMISQPVDTSYEVLSYLHYKHPQPGSTIFVEGRYAHLVDQYLSSVTHHDFVEFVYGQRRTIWSLGNGSVGWDHPSAAVSSHVRCCIAWCITAVPKDKPSMFPCFDTSLQAKGSPTPSASTWQETVALYNYFNKVLLDEEYCRFIDTPLSRSWTENTRESLGISATELLAVCCDMIAQLGSVHGGYTNKKFSNYDILVLELGSIRDDLAKLARQSDEEIVTQFLRHLYMRTTPFALVRDAEEQSPGSPQPAASTISTSESAPTRDYTGASQFPTATSSSISHRSTRDELTRDTTIDEPMATSSLRSSDTSYKRMKDAAASIFNRRFNSMGSRFSLSSRELRLSLAGSIDRMSDIMRDSLRISNPPGQDQGQQASVERKERRGASDPGTLPERQDDTSVTKADKRWI